MGDLTFGEQVKIVLGRKGMTIKQLAEMIEAETGKKMSRQNLTQRLGRDNFQEQDMRMIAEILGCPFQLNIMDPELQALANARNIEALRREEPSQGGTQLEFNFAEQEIVNAFDTTDGEDAGFEAEEQVKREAEEAARREAEEQARREAEEAARREAEEQARREAEEAARREAEEQARRKAEEEARREAEEQARREAEEAARREAEEQAKQEAEVDMTLGDLYDIHKELDELEESVKAGESVETIKKEMEKPKKERFGFFRLFQKPKEEARPTAEQKKYIESEPVEEVAPAEEQNQEDIRDDAADNGYYAYDMEQNYYSDQVNFDGAYSEQMYDESELSSEQEEARGEINPYTGREYESNSVRMHPSRIGYVQVYDRAIHKWTDMTEWAFLGYQERKKAILGDAYEPPIYLD